MAGRSPQVALVEDRLVYTPPQAAEYLNCAEITLRRETARGRLRAVKIGRVLRYRKVDLDAYLEENVVDPSEGQAS
jgi:excisionase family DNA binding protein